MKNQKIWLTIMMLAVMATVGVASGQSYVARVNFQLDEDVSELPAGYVYDEGSTYNDRNGMTYGWDQSATMRERIDFEADERYNGLANMQKDDDVTWEIAVPSGVYDLFIACGDAEYPDSANDLDVEGVVVIDLTPGSVGDADNFDEYTVLGVLVTDGRLTIAPAASADNAKILFVDIMYGDPTYNPAPSAKAGLDQLGYTIDTFQLDGSASSDIGPLDGTSLGTPGGIVSISWTQKSGPGTATFDPIGGDVLSPTVTFDTKGVYELELLVSDIEPKDANDIVVITVKDHADEILVGHWPLDGDADDYSVNSNNGTLEGKVGVQMPVYDTGAVGSHSIDLRDSLGLLADDPNVPRINLGPAPELNFSTGDWTVSLWVKTSTQHQDDTGAMFTHGSKDSGGYMLTMNLSDSKIGRMNLIAKEADGSKLDGAEGALGRDDGFWHHIVAMRDGDSGKLRFYEDGIDSGRSTDVNDDLDVTDPAPFNNYIGVATNGNSDPIELYGTINKHFDGHVDDVRIYNYALPLDDAGYPDILELTAMGPIIAIVNADDGGDGSFNINWKPVGLAPTPITGTITDPGANPVTSGLWSQVDGPAGGTATIAVPGDLATTVTFDLEGVYTLKLEVVDADAVSAANPGGLISDTVVITVNKKMCQADVIDQGLGLAFDINEDCYVNLADIAIIASEWLACNDPQDPTCDWVF